MKDLGQIKRQRKQLSHVSSLSGIEIQKDINMHIEDCGCGHMSIYDSDEIFSHRRSGSKGRYPRVLLSKKYN